MVKNTMNFEERTQLVQEIRNVIQTLHKSHLTEEESFELMKKFPILMENRQIATRVVCRCGEILGQCVKQNPESEKAKIYGDLLKDIAEKYAKLPLGGVSIEDRKRVVKILEHFGKDSDSFRRMKNRIATGVSKGLKKPLYESENAVKAFSDYAFRRNLHD